MKRTPRSLAIGLLLSIALHACSKERVGAEPALLSSPGRWVEVRLPGDLSLLEAPAQTVARPRAEARISPPFSARVLRIHVTPGDHVAEGAPLLDVSMPNVLQAAAVWIASGDRREIRERRRAELESLRHEGLVVGGGVFEQEASIADLRGERASALAILSAAGVRAGAVARVLRSGSITLNSPIAGVVRDLSAYIGEVRDPSASPLVTVLGLSAVRIEARLNRPLPNGASLSFAPIAGDPIPLRSEPLAEVVTPEDGTRLIWLLPEQETKLSSGLRGRLIIGMRGGDFFEVPSSAIGLRAGQSFLLRRGMEGNVAEVPVRVLSTSGASTLVAGPLQVGQLVSEDVASLLSPTEVRQ